MKFVLILTLNIGFCLSVSAGTIEDFFATKMVQDNTQSDFANAITLSNIKKQASAAAEYPESKDAYTEMVPVYYRMLDQLDRDVQIRALSGDLITTLQNNSTDSAKENFVRTYGFDFYLEAVSATRQNGPKYICRGKIDAVAMYSKIAGNISYVSEADKPTLDYQIHCLDQTNTSDKTPFNFSANGVIHNDVRATKN